MNNLLNKKGDAMTPILIGLITLLVVVGAVFLFWRNADLGKVADEQVCYNSVVTRAGVLELSKDLAAPSLNCRTSYYCITKDGSCEIMSSSTRIVKVETADEVYKAIGDKMISCWSMFGEGKLDYMGGKTSQNLYCSNCYQIGFDNSLDMFSGEIEERELYRYLSRTNISGTDATYLKYLIGVNAEIMEQNLDLSNAGFKTFKLGKQYFIVTGVYSNIAEWKTAAIGGAAAVGAFAIAALATVLTGGTAIPGILLIVGGTIAAGGGGTAGYFIGTIADGANGQQFLTPTMIEANSESYESLKCASVNTLA